LNRENLENYLKQLKKLFETNPIKAVTLAVPVKHLVDMFYDGVPLEEKRAKELEAFLALWEEVYRKKDTEKLSDLLKIAYQLGLLPIFDY